jgi:cell division protein FtsB
MDPKVIGVSVILTGLLAAIAFLPFLLNAQGRQWVKDAPSRERDLSALGRIELRGRISMRLVYAFLGSVAFFWAFAGWWGFEGMQDYTYSEKALALTLAAFSVVLMNLVVGPLVREVGRMRSEVGNLHGEVEALTRRVDAHTP